MYIGSREGRGTTPITYYTKYYTNILEVFTPIYSIRLKFPPGIDLQQMGEGIM